MAEPHHYSYLKSLTFVERSYESLHDAKKTVLHIGVQAAAELMKKQVTIRAASQHAEDMAQLLNSVDDDDFARAKQREAGMRIQMYLRRSSRDFSALAWQTAEQAIRDSASPAEFRTRVTNLREQFAEEARQAQQDPLRNTIETFSGDQSTIPAYALNLVRTISDISVLYLTERREPVGKSEARQLLSFKVTRGGPEKLLNIQQTIVSLLGVQVDAFESSNQPPSPDKSAEMDVDNFLLEVNGSGIKEALRLVLDVEFKKPAILLVEEPEVHLHPALETNMMGYLKRISGASQVFLSTHSTNFLDTSEMKNVYFVSKPEGKTEVQLLNLEDAESKLPSELGIRLSSLFMFDRLVFVEGMSDEAIIREWATTLKVNLSQANVGFITMGGARNFAHYAQGAIISFLTKRQVLISFLIDRDERDSAEIEKLRERLLGKVKLEVLAQREIENYLVLPRPLEILIKAKQEHLPKGQYPAVNQSSITAAIEQCAAGLKAYAVGKHVIKRLFKPIYPTIRWTPQDSMENAGLRLIAEIAQCRQQLDGIEQSIDRVIGETELEVENTWDTKKNHFVSGDELLDSVCKHFGVRFRKAVDGPKLAALMLEHEIDGNMKLFIRALSL